MDPTAGSPVDRSRKVLEKGEQGCRGKEPDGKTILSCGSKWETVSHSWDKDLLAPKRTVLIVTPQPRNPRVAPVAGEHTAAGGGARHAATVGWWDGEVRSIDGGPRVKLYT